MSKTGFKRIGGWLVVGLCAAGGLTVAAWVGYRTWPRTLHVSFPPCLPEPVFRGGHLILKVPSDFLLGEVGTFKNELRAYLYFEYVKSLKSVEHHEVLLTVTEGDPAPLYRLYTVVPNDLLAAYSYLGELEAKHFITTFSLVPASNDQMDYRRAQTEVFEAAYNAPVRRRLQEMSPSELITPLVRFMVFKSRTDRRVREGIEPIPIPLSEHQAYDFAADVIAVARFYSLPLAYFLGIGAMENNYMNVNGDLSHVVWKRRAQKGDIVVKRWHGRVLVSDYAIGPWQVTRETLRYAHELFLQDRKKRNYAALPKRLRPSLNLDLDLTNPDVLTTYAGLLFRNLLDRFGGNVTKAVGAYNGGPLDPNLKYAAGVREVAEYARRILLHAGAINGEVLAQTRFFIGSVPRGKTPLHHRLNENSIGSGEVHLAQ